MALRLILAVGLLSTGANALKGDLNQANFKKSIDGKNAFVFFQAPW